MWLDRLNLIEERISGMENLSRVQHYTGTGDLKLKRETEGSEDRTRNDCHLTVLLERAQRKT